MPSSRHPIVALFLIAPFYGRPGDAMGYFLEPRVVTVLGPGGVEGASIDVLRMPRQMPAQRKRQVFVRGVRRRPLLFEWLKLHWRLPAGLRIGLKGKDVGDDFFALVRR